MQQKGQTHSLLEASMVPGRRYRENRGERSTPARSSLESPDKSCKGKNNSQQMGFSCRPKGRMTDYTREKALLKMLNLFH